MNALLVQCACGHEEHIGQCDCGCTIYEPDHDVQVEWHELESAFRWQPSSPAFS
jgi:hypothetical protein